MSVFGLLCQFDGRPVAREDLERMGRALALPEDHGGGQRLDGPCGMVQHRNPFTPEDRHDRQPYSDAGGRYWLLADVRLDNREALLKTFAIPAAEADTTPDGRLVLLAFEKWGRDCPRHLLGDYAFAVWDSLEKSLFCACDPMGLRTLLYHRQGDFLALATLSQGLHALPRVPRALARAGLIDYLALRPLELGKTLFEGIERLPAGYSLSASAGRHERVRFWSLDGLKPIRLANDEAYREAFLELFEQAVRSRLRAVGPVGISMSGGLDSSSVAALAADQLARAGQRLTAFTLVHRRSFDAGVRTEAIDPEYRYVEAMKAMYPNLDVVYLTGRDERMMVGLADDFEQSGIMPHSVVFQRRHRTLFPQVRARGVRVLLNGYNGNTIMSYAGHDIPFALFARGRWLAAYQAIRALQPLSRSSFWGLARPMLLKPFYPRVFDVWINRVFPDRRRHVHDTLGIRASAYPSADPGYFSGIARRLDYNHARKGMLIDGIHNNVADLWTTSRAYQGIEERDPTQDLRLVEFCLALPMDQFLRRGANRFLLRNAMRQRLPRAILERPYFLPREPDMAERCDEVMDELRARLQRIKAADRLDFLDYRQLEAMLDMAPREQRRRDHEPARTVMRAIAMGEFVAWFEGDNG